jgi:pilus assembly protein Flp/PilA
MFQTVMQILKSAAADRRGVTAMEYGLIAGVLAVGLATAFTALSGRLTNAFNVLSF